MSNGRDIRRAAIQALFQFDCGADQSDDIVRESLAGGAGDETTQQEGYELALQVWQRHEEADVVISDLTPEWPTPRQPVIDRNILRLGWFEIISERTPPKVVINEAVELAREFSTDKSPLFVNGVLDKIYRNLREDVATTETED